jgi:iron-sulfur cluster assembly accessory protein
MQGYPYHQTQTPKAISSVNSRYLLSHQASVLELFALEPQFNTKVMTMSAVEFQPQLSNEISVSPEAVKQLITLTENEFGINGIRIFVSGGGCGGMSYGMTFVEEPLPTDCVLEQDGMNVYIDAVALGFLEGVEIDYKDEGMNKSFVFKNVFANTGGAGTCGACGSAGGGCA